jgi:hypothetical protein
MNNVIPVHTVTSTVENGQSVCRLPQDHVNVRKLTRIVIKGPTGSQCSVYSDFVSPSRLLDAAGRGDINTAEYVNPVSVPPGSTVLCVWNSTSPCTATFHVE